MTFITLIVVVLNFLGILGCQEMLSGIEKKLSYIEYLLRKQGGAE